MSDVGVMSSSVASGVIFIKNLIALSMDEWHCARATPFNAWKTPPRARGAWQAKFLLHSRGVPYGEFFRISSGGADATLPDFSLHASLRARTHAHTYARARLTLGINNILRTHAHSLPLCAVYAHSGRACISLFCAAYQTARMCARAFISDLCLDIRRGSGHCRHCLVHGVAGAQAWL